MTSWEMYWLTRMDSLITGLVIVCIITGTFVLVSLLAGMIKQFDFGEKEFNDFVIKIKKPFKWCCVLLIFSILGMMFIPTTKEMAVITYVPKVLNNEKVQELPSNLVDAANTWLKNATKDVTDD